MNELEIRKIAKEEFISNVMNNLDSSLIFAYIQNLEQKVNNLQSKIDKAIEFVEKSMNNPQPWYEYLLGDANGNVENLDKLLNVLKEGNNE